MRIRIVVLTVVGLACASSIARGQTSSASSTRTSVAWTIGGAAGGFGIGLWAGLTAFDDAIDSDRKVWTSAIVGAAAGAVGGYLIGRTLGDRHRSNPSRSHQPARIPEMIVNVPHDPWLGGRFLPLPTWHFTKADRPPDGSSRFVDLPQCVGVLDAGTASYEISQRF
jgi:hypothetical protein